MQKKYLALTIALIYLSVVNCQLSIAHASSPTPSPSPSPSTSDETVNNNLKKRLQQSLEVKATSPISTARAYIGTVKDVIKDTVIIEDKDGKKDIKLSDDTIILRSPSTTNIKPENIRIDDYIIAIGYPDTDNVLTGRRLIISADPITTNKKSSNLGTIVKIGKNTLTLKIEDKEQALELTTKTIFKSTAGTIELGDLTTGDTVVYTATVDESKDQTATVIMRIKTGSVSN